MPNDRKAYHREHYEKNKERINAYNKEWKANNKEKLALKAKEYRENNKEKIKQQRKEYRQNSGKINQWKSRGIIDGDFDLLKKVFKTETHCWICWEPYNGEKRRKCLDHDWSIKDDGNVRYICCHSCNVHVVG